MCISQRAMNSLRYPHEYICQWIYYFYRLMNMLHHASIWKVGLNTQSIRPKWKFIAIHWSDEWKVPQNLQLVLSYISPDQKYAIFGVFFLLCCEKERIFKLKKTPSQWCIRVTVEKLCRRFKWRIIHLCTETGKQKMIVYLNESIRNSNGSWITSQEYECSRSLSSCIYLVLSHHQVRLAIFSPM